MAKKTAFTINNRTQSLTEWCREFNMPYFQVRNRIVRGWSFEDAINKPINIKKKSYIGKNKFEVILPRNK